MKTQYILWYLVLFQVILKDFNLKLPAGKTVAIVGSSGNGKSTIAALLERFVYINLIVEKFIKLCNHNSKVIRHFHCSGLGLRALLHQCGGVRRETWPQFYWFTQADRLPVKNWVQFIIWPSHEPSLHWPINFNIGLAHFLILWTFQQSGWARIRQSWFWGLVLAIFWGNLLTLWSWLGRHLPYHSFVVKLSVGQLISQ